MEAFLTRFSLPPQYSLYVSSEERAKDVPESRAKGFKSQQMRAFFFFQRAKFGCNQGSFQFQLAELYHCPGVSPYFIFEIREAICNDLVSTLPCLLYELRANYSSTWFIYSSYIVPSNWMWTFAGNTLNLHQRKNEHIPHAEKNYDIGI